MSATPTELSAAIRAAVSAAQRLVEARRTGADDVTIARLTADVKAAERHVGQHAS